MYRNKLTNMVRTGTYTFSPLCMQFTPIWVKAQALLLQNSCLAPNWKLPIKLLTATSPDNIQTPPHNYNQEKTQQFASNLGSQLKWSFANVQTSLASSQHQIKLQYGKHTIIKHHYKVGDTEMLWKPYKQKGISRCWQSSWGGPWTITRLIGDLNFQLENANQQPGPLVHFNQLKYVPPRYRHLQVPRQFSVPEQAHISADPCSIFDLLQEGVGDGNGVDRTQNQTIKRSWCNIDTSNILLNRTRSQSIP